VYGSLRDVVIGVTLVLADGTIAHSGGHVIKNVAGFDLAKVMHGSYGTLAVLAEVVLRLHPAPKAAATVALGCSLADASHHAATVLDGPYEPVALEWVGATPSEGTLLVRLEGTAEALPARVTRLLDIVPGSERRADGEWERHAALVRGTPGNAVLRIGALPSRLPPLLGSLPSVSAITAGLGTGVATVAVSPESVAEVHALVHDIGGTSVARSRPAAADVPAWGPPPSALAVLKAVKTSLDPQGRFGPGRFDPWM
jgi:glycolate oxidase FAD binding subunit